MRKITFLAVLSAALLAASSVQAKDITFGLNAGIGIPVGDFGDEFGVGFAGGVYADYWTKPSTAFGVDILGNFHGGKDSFTDPAFPGVSFDSNVSIYEFGVHGLWAPPAQGKTQPWLKYGLGLYNSKLTVEGGGIKEDTSDSNFGLNGGGGIDLKSNPSMHIGIGGIYHYVFTEDTATQYVNLSLYLTFMTNGAQ
jgi:Outer membrane protein beta-barrel domain